MLVLGRYCPAARGGCSTTEIAGFISPLPTYFLMPCFEDNFSNHAATYARYRPTYPAALFKYLAGAASGHELAWDCGCGSGQSALALAEHFQRVIASDGSRRQIEHAARHRRVHYRVALAEASGLPARSVDLVTVSQALHWFDLPKFYAEVRRVLNPGGLIAAWCYDLTLVTPPIDSLLARYHRTTLKPFWSPRVRFANEHYRKIPFPFTKLRPPSFTAEADWNLEELLGYLTSWSATQRFIDLRGYSPVDQLRQPLTAAWGDPNSRRRVRWPLYLRLGKRG